MGYNSLWKNCCNCAASGSCSCGMPCGSCQIPRKDLQLDWTNLILGDGSTTLYYQGIPTTQWTSECTHELIYQLSCTQNREELRVYYFLSGSCPSGQSQYCSSLRSAPNQLIAGSGNVCGSGISLFYTDSSFSCPNIATLGYTSFLISDSTANSDLSNSICAQFEVLGCGNWVLPDVTVSIYDSGGSNLLANGITGPRGTVWLSWPGNPGTYLVEAESDSDRFAVFDQLRDINCISPVQSIQMEPASGYACACCVLPLKTTLQGTLSIDNYKAACPAPPALTFKYGVIQPFGPAWFTSPVTLHLPIIGPNCGAEYTDTFIFSPTCILDVQNFYTQTQVCTSIRGSLISLDCPESFFASYKFMYDCLYTINVDLSE